MSKTLLQLAKDLEIRNPKKDKKYTDEDKELIIAWANDEVNLTQLQKVKEFNNTSMTYFYIAMVSRLIIASGKLND